MTNKTLAVLVLLITGLCLSVSAGKIEWAKERYKEYNEKLNEKEKEAARYCMSLLELLLTSKKLEEAEDKDIINIYEELYELSVKDNGKALFGIFHTDYVGIPLIIAQICRDSNTMTDKEKVEIVKRQLTRSNDDRIAIIRINQIQRLSGFQAAIDYCVEQVSDENNNVLIPLAKLRIEYQGDLVQRALKEKGIETWEANVIEHGQLKKALSEAREAIAENPNMVAEYDRVFHEAFELFSTTQEAVSFYEFALSQMARVAPTDRALVSKLNEHLSAHQKNQPSR